MPINPRRSSGPKQASRSPHQDGENKGPDTQTTSGRVSLSTASRAKEFDSSFNDKTAWDQSTDDSLESIEGDENQSRSANVLDEPANVQTQKKSKRKRMPTVQPFLNSSGIATSNLNQSVQQSPNTRVLKQPRKSLDCSKATFYEEGDTQMFFDELNLTEPIVCSYSNMDTSLSTTKALMDSVLDYSRVNPVKTDGNSPPGVLLEYTSKNIVRNDSIESSHDDGVMEKTAVNEDLHTLDTEAIIQGGVADKWESLNMSVDGVNMECTLPAENVETGGGYSNDEGSKDPNCSILKEIVSNPSLSFGKDFLKDETLNNTSATVVGDSDHDDLLPVTPVPEKTVASWASENPLDETTSLEDSMNLTIPPVIRESNLSKVEHQEGSIRVVQGKQDSEATDLEETCTWGQIAMERNPISPSVSKTDIDVVCDKSESFTGEKFVKDEVADCSVNHNLDLSMSGGLVGQGTLVEESLNVTLGNSFTDEFSEGKEFAVPSKEMILCKGGGDLKEGDCLQPLEVCVAMLRDPNILADVNVEEDFPKDMKERSFAEETVNFTYYSNGLDEMCADMHGMDMTVPLGKIREKIAVSITENAMPHGADKNNASPQQLMSTGLEVDDFPEESKKTEEETTNEHHPADSGLVDAEVSSDGASQTLKQTEAPSISALHQSFDELYDQPISPKSAGTDATLPLLVLKENEYREAEDSAGAKSLVIDDNLPDAQKMELIIPSERIMGEHSESPLKPLCQSPLMDGSISVTMCMDATLPLGDFQGKTRDCCDDNVISETQILDETKHEGEDTNDLLPESLTMDDSNSGTMCMDFTVPQGIFKGETQDCTVNDMLSDSQIMNQTKSEAVEMSDLSSETHIMDETTPEMIGMELTVPLGRFKEEIREHSVDNVLSERQIMDRTALEKMGMKLDVSVEGVKKAFYIDDQNLEETLVNTVDESQTQTDGNLAAVEVESSAPLAEEETVNLTTTVLEDSEHIDDTKGHSLCLRIPSQSGTNGEDQVTESLAEMEVMDDSAPEPLAMESLEVEIVDVAHPDSSVTDSLLMDDTISDTMGMEMTIPLGRLKRRKSQDTDPTYASKHLYVTEINPKVEAVEFPSVSFHDQKSLHLSVEDNEAPKAECETNVSEIGKKKSEVEVADSVEGIEKDFSTDYQKLEETLANTVDKSEILTDGKPEEFEVESSAPLAVEETVNLTTTVMEDCKDMDDSKAHSLCLEITSQSGEVVESNEEEQVTESVTKMEVNESLVVMEVMDDTASEPLAEESVEVEVVDVTHTDSSVSDSMLMDDTISDTMGMEMTLPLGRLRQRKFQNADPTDVSKHLHATEINPKFEKVEFAVPLDSSDDRDTLNSSVENKEGPNAEHETSIRELGEKSELDTTDTVPEAENAPTAEGVNDSNSLEKQFCVSSEWQDGGNLVLDEDCTLKPIPELEDDAQGVGVELTSSFLVPNEQQNGDFIANDLPGSNAEVETHSRVVMAESSISLDVVDEDMNEESEDGAGDCIPEPEAMEHSLSEAVGSDQLTGKAADTYLETSNLEVNCKEIALDADSQSHSFGTADGIVGERKSLSPLKGPGSGGIASDIVEKLSSEDCNSIKIVGVDSCITLAGPNESKTGDFVPDESSESHGKDGIILGETRAESSSVIFEQGLNQEVEAEAVECEKQEVITPDLEPMNQSLSVAIGSELHTADSTNMECDDSKSKGDFKDPTLEIDDCGQTLEDISANVGKRQSLSPPSGQEDRDQVDYIMDQTNTEDGDPNDSDLLEYKTGKETYSGDEKVVFRTSLERREELSQDFDGEELKNLKEEEGILEQEAMEQSLTEAMEGEPQASDIGDGVLNISKPEVELNNTILCDDNQNVDVTNTTSKEESSVGPAEEQVCSDIVCKSVEKPCSEDGNDMEGDGAGLNYSLALPVMEENGDPILNESLESYTECETITRDTPAESNFSLERCDEKVNEEPDDVYEGEEYDPEQEPMEMSLSETIHNDLQAVISSRIQGVCDVSFSIGDYMDLYNTPAKVPQTPKFNSSVRETPGMGSLEVIQEIVAENSAEIESDVHPSLSEENDGLQLSNSLSERYTADCEKLLSNINHSFTESEVNKGTDTTFEEQKQKKSDAVNAEVNSAVYLENVESHEVNTATESLPCPISAPVDVVNDAATLNHDCLSQLPLPEGESTIKGEVSVDYCEHDSGVVPSEDFSLEREQIDNPSFASVDNITNPSDELPVACVSMSERDEGDDFMEPMDVVYDQDAMKSNESVPSAEVKTDLHSDSGYVKVEECIEFQLTHGPSNEEEIWENTSFVTADSFESSMEDLEVDVVDVEEDSKPVNSIEVWIREESNKESCVWTESKILGNQYYFVVFHDAAVLTVNLNPLNEAQDSEGDRTVECVELKSCISDNYDRCLKVVMNVMLKRLPSSFLSSKCPTTKQLPSLFEFLNTEFLALNQLLQQTYELMRASPVRMKNDGFSFMVPSVERMLLIEVQVYLLNWDKDGVKSEDVQVKNLIGKMGDAEIQSVFQSVECDEHYFRNVYNDVLKFISTVSRNGCGVR